MNDSVESNLPQAYGLVPTLLRGNACFDALRRVLRNDNTGC